MTGYSQKMSLFRSIQIMEEEYETTEAKQNNLKIWLKEEDKLITFIERDKPSRYFF